MNPAHTLAYAALIQGWLAGASLIVAIGAQNALVLRQGLMRRHVAPVVGLCIAADVLLICLGVFGLGAWIARTPWLLSLFRWGGAVFLLCYGLRAAQRAWRGGAALAAAGLGSALRGTLLSAAALTFLNPHVYLDTVVLLGTLGAQLAAELRPAFALGASLASLMWFSLLGFGASAASGVLHKPWVWRAIDGLVALLMGVLGLQLVLKPLA